VRIEYSADERLLYLRLKDGEVTETVELDDGVMADLDDAGEPIGVEFLDAADFFPFVARRTPLSDGMVIFDLPGDLATILKREGQLSAHRG